VPSTVAPSKNCTVPVAVAGATVATKVTEPPTMEGFGVAVKVVVVAEPVTVWVTTGAVLPE